MLFINLSKLADSLTAFLKAEEMSTNECTESQILDTVDAFRGLNTSTLFFWLNFNCFHKQFAKALQISPSLLK